jgi:hypothetical protein
MWKPWIARRGAVKLVRRHKKAARRCCKLNLQQKDATGASRDLAPIIRSSTL